MKKHNPTTPIMMREALDIEPRVFARYGMKYMRGGYPFSMLFGMRLTDK